MPLSKPWSLGAVVAVLVASSFAAATDALAELEQAGLADPARVGTGPRDPLEPVVLGPEAPAAALPPAPPACATPVVDARCITDTGQWRHFLQDGTTILTHLGRDEGPDHADPDLGEEGFQAQATPQNMPICVDHTTTYHFWAVYAYQSTNDWSAQAPNIRVRVKQANYLFDERAHQSSYHNEYQQKCFSSDVWVVAAGPISCGTNGCDYGEILNKVRSYSWGQQGLTKYMIFFDGTKDSSKEGCGRAGIDNDSSDSVNNLNNDGPAYAVMFCWKGDTLGNQETLLHETFHNMGAVQLDTPENSGGWHCNDGYDVMCYADGGSRSNYRTTACASPKKIDCNRNDYCHNGTPSGYLLTHWNMCDAYNRWTTKTSV